MPKIARNSRSARHLLVIGGGIAGVAAAVRLRTRGATLTLLDRHRALGGRARSETIEGMTIDIGAQLAASSFARVRRLVQAPNEKGAPAFRTMTSHDTLLTDGVRHSITFGSITSLLAFGGLGAMDKFRLGARLVPLIARHRDGLEATGMRVPVELDRANARGYLDAEIGNRVADLLAEPALNAFYAARGAEVSLAFFLTLGRYGTDGGVLAPSGGWSALFERALGAGRDATRHEGEAEIVALDRSDGGLIARGDDGREWRGDGAVIAAGPRTAHHLLTGLGADGALLEWLRSIELRPTWTLALALDAPAPHDVFGAFPDPRAASTVSACVVQGTKLGPSARRDADVVLAWPTPQAIARLEQRSTAEIVSEMMPDVEALVPSVRGHVARARLFRLDEGTPLARPGFGADRVRGRQLAELIAAPVTLAGDFLAMPLLEGAAASGEDAADRLMERLDAAGVSGRSD
ncbi:MAG: FAD-dependent oxidoreductase [Gemmatimonadota bacterium]|nr:FAD-dependent oxidoreductase [Gemmatimonadota bacterium]